MNNSPHHPMFGTDPGPLNPDARPGFGKAVSEAYAAYCESPEAPEGAGPNPVRAAKYREICEELEGKYPTHREIWLKK